MLWVPAAPAAASIALVFGFGRLDDFGRQLLPRDCPQGLNAIAGIKNRGWRHDRIGVQECSEFMQSVAFFKVWAFIVFVRVDIRMPAQRCQHHVLGQLLRASRRCLVDLEVDIAAGTLMVGDPDCVGRHEGRCCGWAVRKDRGQNDMRSAGVFAPA